ncbi:uncharacterized protein LTHEOB_11556 [Lasiodiplodia theobromae]|uniref:uncharacterized protein n=1 Tax=Lasiodiplodia theobromae TaxID=45133 RepID=UPI0015C3C9B6|nr:uncharacterized protein LTHEOB_11556 [Lasiodiplodia theobromae]KAF4537178.1 hypothetical protein LTHEOB_11556 [Lasiodiplodia theobromae]
MVNNEPKCQPPDNDSCSDSDSDNGGHENGDVSLEDQFKDIIHQIQSVKKGKGEGVAQGIFKNYFSVLGRALEDKTNFLHKIAKYARREQMDVWLELMRKIIATHGHLMKKDDYGGKTPMQLALENGRSKLIQGMLTAVSTDDIDDVLLKTTKDGNNCLHTILGTHSISSALALEFIEKMKDPAKVLCTLNRDDLSPLHIATEYNRCTESQYKVVEAIINRCDSALDVNVSLDDPKKLSVYRYHEKTRMEALKKPKATKEQGSEMPGSGARDKSYKSQGTGPGDISTPNMRMPQQKAPVTSPEMPQQHTSNSGTTPRERLQRVRTEAPLGHENGKTRQYSVVSGGMKPSKGSAMTQPEKNKSSSKEKGGDKEKGPVTENSAKAIRNLLKIRFMCGRTDPEKILAFLYKPDEVKEIYFSLPGGPGASITKDVLDRMKYLDFEDTLQYVHIPMLQVEKTGPAASRRNATSSRGRNDYVDIFKWLKEEKKVERIVNLQVEDVSEIRVHGEQAELLSHSDESIEKALKGIEVLKTWDWKKFDLSSETIRTVAGRASSVVLYWGGNDAILRSWSEREGLVTLERLRTVTVYGERGLETDAKAQKDMQNFKRRLLSSQRILNEEGKDIRDERTEDIKVECSLDPRLRKSTASRQPRKMAPEQPKEQHEWLITMDKFATFIQGLKLDLNPELEERPIRVAVIDDGIDITEKSLQGKVIGGRSFCQRVENEQMPYYVTEGWHGTVMASLICRVCPKAQLYIVRLDEYLGEDGRRHITAESAAKAVRAAVHQDVDIISMSWTIEETVSNVGSLKQLREAINEAVEANILLFCSANDQISNDNSFPGLCTEKRFKIGAATQYRKPTDSTGEIPVNFIMPGQNVLRERPEQVPLDSCNLLTGSSVATALASGLAALILHCVQFAALRTELTKPLNTDGSVTMDDFKKLKSHDEMQKAFGRIPKDIASRGKFLLVGQLFNIDRVVDKTEKEKQKFVQEIAWMLVHSPLSSI